MEPWQAKDVRFNRKLYGLAKRFRDIPSSVPFKLKNLDWLDLVKNPCNKGFVKSFRVTLPYCMAERDIIFRMMKSFGDVS